MKSFSFKALLPHLIAVVVFLIAAALFCQPAIKPGVGLKKGHDVSGWEGMSKQSFEYKEKNGHFPLWSNSMFSGMPAYQIAMDGNEGISQPMTFLNSLFSFGLKQPMNFFFLSALMFYLLCIIAGVNPWLGILGGLSYAFATYNPIIISVGHNTKMMSLAYAPMLLGGILLLFKKRYLLGFTTTAFFATSLIGQNHPQIVFYTLIIVAIFSLSYLVHNILAKQMLVAVNALSLAMVAGVIGVACNALILLTTYDYSKESMRGGVSQLTLEKDAKTNKTKGGLDKDYALRWSMGKMETFTFMVPGLFGGSNGGNEHGAKSKFVEKMGEYGVPEETSLGAVNSYSYWGSMSSLSETTSGPAYLGAIICFLFIFGVVYLKGWQKWGLLVATLFGIMLGWGSNLYAFNSFLLDYMPLFSKFRAPSMAMVIPQLCIPFLGILSLQAFFFDESAEAEKKKKFKQAMIATASVLGFVLAFMLLTDYTGKGDEDISNQFSQFAAQISGQGKLNTQEVTADMMAALRADRKSEAFSDFFRSLLLIGLGGLLVFLYNRKKLTLVPVSIGLILLVVFDLFVIDKRYLNNDKFEEQTENEILPTSADQAILSDPDHANFRVFNTTTSYTNESTTSYFHNSIGGYHPAKLGLYQDLIQYQINKGNREVLNMLNTKYIILGDGQGNVMAQRNDQAYGNCWLVKNVKQVHSPNEEMLALDSSNLRETAVINQANSNLVPASIIYDSSAVINLKQRDNDHIVYQSNTASPQVAVFSEVYYPRGWNATIDGKKAEHFKVDYVLRGLTIPAGQHTIEFDFHPESYYTGLAISKWGLICLYVLLLATAGFYIFQAVRKKD